LSDGPTRELDQDFEMTEFDISKPTNILVEIKVSFEIGARLRPPTVLLPLSPSTQLDTLR
jgi:hypothetical protein